MAALPPGEGAEGDWFARRYTEGGVELRADERVFALFAVLNALGYDEGPVLREAPVTSRAFTPARRRVRQAARLDERLAERFQAFFDAHPAPADVYGRYVLTLEGPPLFERTSTSAENLKGFELLLAEAWRAANLGGLHAEAFDEYRTAFDGYLGVLDAPVEGVRRLLKMRAGEPPRVVVVSNLLDGHGRSFSVALGETLFVVVGPGAADLQGVAAAVARTRLEPLASGRSGREAVEELVRAFGRAAAAGPEAERGSRGPVEEAGRLVAGFARGDRPLEPFVAEALTALAQVGRRGDVSAPGGAKRSP